MNMDNPGTDGDVSHVGKAFERLTNIMDELREQCPWDRKQTLESLRSLTIEEMYELTDAILDSNWDDIKEELGDILLHLVFYAKIASEQGQFAIADVIHDECDKLVRRHPHIYGDIQVESEEDVRRNWEKLKLQEGKKSVFSGVPQGMPALVKATRLQSKAAQVGFDWSRADDVWDKVQEEIRELQEAKTPEDKEEEFGDTLFAMVNYARFIGVDPDAALSRANTKFQRRFRHIEQRAADTSRPLDKLTLDEMEAYWNEAKQLDK